MVYILIMNRRAFMKTLIVYDSVFGNTGKIAVAMGEKLGAKTAKVADIRTDDMQGLSLLIVGSPTRGFQPMPTITEWMKQLPQGSLNGVRVAAFDTRTALESINSGLLKKMMKCFGYASQKIAKGLIKKGGVLASQAGFSVSGSEGPLKGGELECAVSWAQGIQEG